MDLVNEMIRSEVSNKARSVFDIWRLLLICHLQLIGKEEKWGGQFYLTAPERSNWIV